MSHPRSKRYILEQRAYMVEQYFRISLYKIALGRFKKSLRRCQTLKRSNELLKDSKLLTRSKMNRDREDRILSQTMIELN